jgi:hypothetical protein
MTYRVAIDDVVNSFSSRIHSHKTGWARMQRCMVQDMCDRFPESEDGVDSNEVRLLFSGERKQVVDARAWMISHDMAFDGEHYNLFGGWSADIHHSLREFAGHHNVLSLERPMPDLERILRPRAEKTKSNLTDEQWARVSRQCAKTPVIQHIDLFRGTEDQPHTVVLGDSHAVAQYTRGRLVLRNDGLTLHRLVEDGVRKWLGEHNPSVLVITAGSIDLRHHLLRQDNPEAAVRVLYANLSKQLEKMMANGEIMDFQVVMPYPVEHEGRRIPQTGFYKKTPFYGSQTQRAELLEYMMIVANSVFGFDQVFRWPASWYEMDPETWANTYMERPGSVHLSPAWHRWDYETNSLNTKLREEYTK